MRKGNVKRLDGRDATGHAGSSRTALVSPLKNVCNLHPLVGRGGFRFIGLPPTIRGNTSSPVRAVAVFGE